MNFPQALCAEKRNEYTPQSRGMFAKCITILGLYGKLVYIYNNL